MDAVRARLYGAGKRLQADVAMGEATFPASATATLPAGTYSVEWEVVDSDSNVTLPDGDPVRVVPSAKEDQLSQVPRGFWRETLDAARKALLAAAATGEVSFSAGDSNYTFENRADLLAFVKQLERQVRNKPVRVRTLSVA